MLVAVVFLSVNVRPGWFVFECSLSALLFPKLRTGDVLRVAVSMQTHLMLPTKMDSDVTGDAVAAFCLAFNKRAYK